MHLCLLPPGVSATTRHTRCVLPPQCSGAETAKLIFSGVCCSTLGGAGGPNIVDLQAPPGHLRWSAKVKSYILGGVGWLFDRLKRELSWWEKHVAEFNSAARLETQGATQL